MFRRAGEEDVLLVWSWLYMPRLSAATCQATLDAAAANFTAHASGWGLPMSVAFVNATILTVRVPTSHTADEPSQEAPRCSSIRTRRPTYQNNMRPLPADTGTWSS